MKIYRGLDRLPYLPSVITSGTFDGVHLGHKAIFDTVCRIASERSLRSLVVTFHPHPRIVLQKNPETLTLLNSLKERMIRIGKSGVQALCIVEFTPSFSLLEPDEYLRLLKEKAGLQYLVVGYDHHFGRERRGSPAAIQPLCKDWGIGFEQVDPVEWNGVQISSTKIRQALREGRVADANTMLGYTYSLEAVVVKGDGLGRQLGFPTANLRPRDPLKLVPVHGIYAAEIVLDNRLYYGMAYVGERPTLEKSGRQVEVHIFDFNQSIYGKKLTLRFVDYLRADSRFPSLDHLAQALQEDARTARRRLGLK
ncbi:MAG: bifunctional riboflavin kinase/FAD synthetase [Flavobacteriales bacterium]|nr:bifunctional riboflavin kinase/FAD synthetase [Flavobacteriales bacterium]MCX7768898.1 bifunctional riboflavin kinase/FAD synthetase [Flavobacteriales bacterium]MDW8410024.1 bifunctional riboflavin kinase/FAD synthetase [Flavobacteriales bacterium]